MSNPVRPHRRQPTRFPRPWDSQGKNTGVGCHFLLQCVKVKSESEVTHLCPTRSDSMDCSLPGSSVHGIFQARGLEWGAIAFSILCTLETCYGHSNTTHIHALDRETNVSQKHLLSLNLFPLGCYKSPFKIQRDTAICFKLCCLHFLLALCFDCFRNSIFGTRHSKNR